MELKRVVVTGLGALTPIGNNVGEYWQNLLDGVSGACPITNFDASKFKTKFACQLKGFDPLQFMEKKDVKRHDRYSQYALACSEEIVKDSGIDLDNINLNRAGVIWASGIGGLDTFVEEMINFSAGDGTPKFNPFFIPKMIADIAAGHISMRYGLRGLNFATVSACASSANAIVDAFNYVRLGKADIIIAGGSEASVNIAGVAGFNAMHALSTRNDDYKTASRPFDKDRDGFVIGEGAAGIMVESLEHALARGAKIYCEIGGGGLSADAYHLTAPHPDGDGAKRAMIDAMEDAGMSINDIDHINTHGTSTPAGDVAETKAIMSLFGNKAKELSINSTKSMTGHLLGAAGAAEAVATVLSVQNDIIPPTINHFTDDPEIPDLDYTFWKPKKRIVRAALTNTFGFGGHNVSLLFKKYND